MPTEPAGISLRGVSRRGVANCLRQPRQKWKTSNEPDTGYTVFTAAVEIHHFARRNLCLFRHSIEVERELGIVANWNFDWARNGFRPSHAPTAMSARGYNFANSFCQPIEQLAGFSAHFRDDDRIKKNCDAGVSRREFNHTGNSGIAKQVKCTEDLVQRFFRRILKLVADTHNESRISKSRNLHARKRSTSAREL